MIISYYGLQFFKFQLGDLTLAINPIGKNAQYKSAHFGADIALVSLNHPDMNGVENLSYGERKPFVVDGPGEYEVKGVSIRGFPVTVSYGGKNKKINTIYFFTFDNSTICFLGALDTAVIDEEIHEHIADVDMLFVPVGGNAVLSSADANKLSVSFSPKVIIPMHYDAASLKKFLNEAGTDVSTAASAKVEGVKPIDKLTIKKKDMEGKEGEIIVLKQA